MNRSKIADGERWWGDRPVALRVKAIVGLSVLCIFFSSFARGDESLIAGAKKEGQLVWYTTTAQTDNKPVLDAFMKKYPFIKAQSMRAGGPELAEKFLFERRAGQYIADVIRVLDFDVERFKRENMVARYRSPSAEKYSSDMKDPDGYWTTDDYTIKVVGYNTSLLAAKDAPKSWFDLLDPKWQGKLVVEILDYRLYAGWEQRLGVEKATRLAEGMARQKIILRRGASQIAELLAAGESPLAQAYVHHLEVLKAKGAPVDWIRTFDPLVALRGGVAISANAPHPNAARLFVDFYLSKEGAQIIRTWGKVPGHPEVEPFHKALQSKDLKIQFLDPKLTAQNYAHYTAMAKKAFYR
jgi:iron(III) transport system substrate-binding protein